MFGGTALGRLLLHPGDDGADPGAGRQHRVQRLPAAGRDPGPRQEPAAAAEQPRRPAGLQQRHHHAGRSWPRILIVIYKADVTRLIQLYIIGVFTSFTLGQTGMVRHWNRALRTERDPDERRRIMRSRAINAFGASCAASC